MFGGMLQKFFTKKRLKSVRIKAVDPRGKETVLFEHVFTPPILTSRRNRIVVDVNQEDALL